MIGLIFKDKILYIPGPSELFLILALIVILIWGPSQLPKLARALGQAKREFRKAQEEGEEEEDDIIKLAKEFGIDTKNKSREEILEEIRRIAKKSE